MCSQVSLQSELSRRISVKKDSLLIINSIMYHIFGGLRFIHKICVICGECWWKVWAHMSEEAWGRGLLGGFDVNNWQWHRMASAESTEERAVAWLSCKASGCRSQIYPSVSFSSKGSMCWYPLLVYVCDYASGSFLSHKLLLPQIFLLRISFF